MNIIYSPLDKELSLSPYVQQLQNAYQDMLSDTYFGYGIISTNDIESPRADNVPLIMCRTLIQNGYRLKAKSQKYVMLIKFANFGDAMMIDLISLDKEYHKDIALGHYKRIGVEFSENIMGDVAKVRSIPQICVGSYLKMNNGNLLLSGESGDFGNEPFDKVNGDHLANLVLKACGIDNVMHYETDKGEEIIKKLLAHMSEHKLTTDFYEKTFDVFSKKDRFQTGWYKNMKILDRVIAGEGDMLTVSAQELTEGFGRHVAHTQIAKKISENK